MDEGGVDAGVIHPSALDPNSTALSLQAVKDYPAASRSWVPMTFSSNLRMAAPGHEPSPKLDDR